MNHLFSSVSFKFFLVNVPEHRERLPGFCVVEYTCVRTNEHIPSPLRNESLYVCSDIINIQYAFIFNYVPIHKDNLKSLGSKYAS